MSIIFGFQTISSSFFAVRHKLDYLCAAMVPKVCFFGAPGLNGNAVKIGDSSRCCEFLPPFLRGGTKGFGILCHWPLRGPGRRRNRNESEDLPCVL